MVPAGGVGGVPGIATCVTSVVDCTAGELLVFFAFAMSWIGVWMGLTVRTVESAQQIGFTLLFPLTFVSNVFVPPSTLPSWLRPVAEWNPVTTLSEALRQLFDNPSFPSDADAPWSLQHPVLYTWIWIIGIILVFAPLAVRTYQRKNVS